MKWVPEEATEMISSLRREQREAHLQWRIRPLPAGAELGSGDPGKELQRITLGNHLGNQGRVGEGTCWSQVFLQCSQPLWRGLVPGRLQALTTPGPRCGVSIPSHEKDLPAQESWKPVSG